MITQALSRCLAVGATAALANACALAGGFEVPAQGSRATGQGDAFVAQADDPSAIHYNPAGLTQLRGTQLTSGVYAIFPEFQFHGDGPVGNAETDDPIFIPHLYAVTDAVGERWRLGVGVNNVFGISEDWGEDSPLQQSVTDASLMVINVTPTAAYRVNEHLSLGVGLNLYYGDVELNNTIALPAGPARPFRFRGDGTGIGATAGALWTIDSKNAVGVVYRSPMRIEFDGSASIAGVARADADTTVDFPQSVVLGYAYRPNNRLKLEVDVQWMNWEVFDRVALKSGDSRFSAIPPIRFEYRDAFTYRFGAEYRIDDHWALRAGYFYSQSAARDETFNPVVMDLDSHVFTLGVGYSRPRWAIDLAYHLVLGEDRSVRDSINSPPGEYSDLTHTLMASVTLRF